MSSAIKLLQLVKCFILFGPWDKFFQIPLYDTKKKQFHPSCYLPTSFKFLLKNESWMDACEDCLLTKGRWRNLKGCALSSFLPMAAFPSINPTLVNSLDFQIRLLMYYYFVDDIDLGDPQGKPKGNPIMAALNKQKLTSKFQALNKQISGQLNNNRYCVYLHRISLFPILLFCDFVFHSLLHKYVTDCGDRLCLP